jgi:tRNA(Ile2) C34 agmatinyltransferase TiaS
MICPKCDTHMDSMGYGDEQCPNCGRTSYSESRDDFNLRIYGTTFKDEPDADNCSENN